MDINRKVVEKNDLAVRKLCSLKKELEATKYEMKEQLKKENTHLKEHIEQLKNELIFLEESNGKRQIHVPGESSCGKLIKIVHKKQKLDAAPKIQKANKKLVKDEPISTAQNEKLKGGSSGKAEDDSISVHVGLLDLRIGRIIDISQHPDADSLYLEKIDCGEETARTVISGLVKHIPIDQMRNRSVVVLCNLKPAKMRGIVSEAMVMCASTPEKVEVLDPPAGSNPGDLVHCKGFERNPPTQLNPKKKIFETVALELKTNSDLIACYAGQPLYVPEKGNIKAQSLVNANIK